MPIPIARGQAKTCWRPGTPLARLACLLLCTLAATEARAVETAISYAARPCQLQVRASGEHALRVTLIPIADVPTTAARLRSPVLLNNALEEPGLTLDAGDGIGEAKVGSFRVQIKASPLTLTVSDADGRLLQTLAFDPAGSEVSFDTGAGPILGLGEGGQEFDRRGAVDPMRSGQEHPGKAVTGVRVPVSLVIGTGGGWALLALQPDGAIDLSGPRGTFRSNRKSPATETGAVADLFLIDLAHNPQRLFSELARLTGAPALPPKWALGYMQSHRTLASEDEMLGIARTFREKKLPCDALIYLGTGFCPAGWNVGHDTFDFNPAVFKRSPRQVIADLHALSFRVVMHVMPKMDRPLYGSIPPAAGEVTDSDHVATYWKRHEPLLDSGVDAWWPDDGDWLDLTARLARHAMYYNGSLTSRSNERPWSLHRNGALGVARYGGWIWSGDVQGQWKTLAAQVPVGLNASLSVTPYWGTDCGGFFKTAESDGELFARWFQFAAFCPSFRSHGMNWYTHLPWGWNDGGAGPTERQRFPRPSARRDARVEPICKQYLDLRYALMSYTYTAARQCHDTGLPLMRALWLHAPDDPQAVANGADYLWGRDLLVAPVVERGATHRKVYLPRGEWYDWWTGEKHTGGASIDRAVDLQTMPIYVRAGAMIPLDPPRQFVDEPANAPMTLRVFSGADGRASLYEDDGHTLAYQSGGAWTAFAWDEASRTLTITRDPRTPATASLPRRTFDVRVLPGNASKTVMFDGGAPAAVSF